ncbi:hypothetical protein PCANC_27122 [Puccinia coronata f. sp. avenae]|uniref:Mannosyltransferase n=1 Tax=Puccinia coronata f. sp. avenae TaxID=200324 RepID=A0A2N5TA08_9BASI|nr:hypothetical protein PCANC_27122 [Puccinia coronata f. sp. avenae]
MEGTITKHQWTLNYVIAISLRLIIVLTSTSFIHPDEHFQNTEIAVDDVFKQSKYLTRTWEWDPLRLSGHGIGGGPVRSIVPVWLTSHLGLYILKFAHASGLVNISTRSLVIFPRLVLFLLSLWVDRLIFQFVRSRSIQLLHAFSLHSMLFVCRSFSNSLESILFSSVFLLSLSISNPKNPAKLTSVIAWTLLNVFAVWVRVSYICFAFPIVIAVGHTRLFRSFALLCTLGATALLGMAVLIWLDCLYFGRWPTITPVNFLIYNLDQANLAQHGTHPRYLHLLVNGSIMFGPALWFTGWDQIWTRLKPCPMIVKLSIASLVSGTLLLSIQPHQEPRFLLPLIFPLTILCSQPMSKSSSTMFRKMFWIAHLFHLIITVALFGFLHQGGVQSALELIPAKTEILLSYKTFDIPTSLITSAQISRVENLRGAGEEVLVRTVCETVSSREDPQIVLIAPRLDEIFNAGHHKYGIGLYKIHPRNIQVSQLC